MTEQQHAPGRALAERRVSGTSGYTIFEDGALAIRAAGQRIMLTPDEAQQLYAFLNEPAVAAALARHVAGEPSIASQARRDAAAEGAAGGVPLAELTPDQDTR
jgi:hypothetical protein